MTYRGKNAKLVKPEDFLPKFGKQKRGKPKRMSSMALKHMAELYNAALGGVDLRGKVKRADWRPRLKVAG